MNKTEILHTLYENFVSIANNAGCIVTNGDVIKSMFPDADYEIGKQFIHITNVNSIGELSIPLTWWNTPYSADNTKDKGQER